MTDASKPTLCEACKSPIRPKQLIVRDESGRIYCRPGCYEFARDVERQERVTVEAAR